MSAKVGTDVEALCRKCGDVWHVVVAMVDDKVAKVVCKECGGQHRYRPGAGTEQKAAKAVKVKKKRRTTTRKPRRTSGSMVPLVEPDLSRPVRSYAMSESFRAGDRIEHPTFGSGLVEREVGPGKIQVHFGSARRVLVHQRGS